MNKMAAVASLVNEVNRLEEKVKNLSDAQMRQRTVEFKEYLAGKLRETDPAIKELEVVLKAAAIQEEKERIKEKIKLARNKIYADILPEAFALVREASRRVIGLRHFDVQIAGGIVLHEGKIAEMATGEGKTLVATLPAYLNALLGKGVHVVTVNDYLARRDREWMGPVYEFLGLSIGVVQHDMPDEERQQSYACDITYGTNNEFGFDYLRDNMKYSKEDVVQRPFYYAIVDEVDSILVDESRTPLIISGASEDSTDKYYIVDKVVRRLKGRMISENEEIDAKYKGNDLSKGFDYLVNEKARAAYLTDEGEAKVCSMLGIDNLHDLETMEWRHHAIQALYAHNLYKEDVDYVLKDGKVVIVDEFTGRLMPGRRWSDGLHQAIEAKEGMKIEQENQTLATITFQNYFRMYEKLAGMTGTAYTEANEFKSIYKLDVVVIPTNRSLIRDNFADCIYKTEEEKFKAVVDEIAGLYDKGKPVLVGTISIDKSERLSLMLKKRGIPHQVLNAKYHELEAHIVAQAGRYKAITIATNMAGRGTDILLGGNPDFMAKNVIKQRIAAGEEFDSDAEYRSLLEKYRKEAAQEHDKVVAVGGLHVLGTERHEARRIDNQLRGRCGRQGDPGSSRFYVSLADELMRLFGSDRLMGVMDKLGFEEGQVIEHPWVSRSIEIAQKRVEQHNFEIRKQLLEYDNVMNKQREIIYGQRREILEGVSLRDNIMEIIEKILGRILSAYQFESEGATDEGVSGLMDELRLKFGLESDHTDDFGSLKMADILKMNNKDQIKERLYRELVAVYERKESALGEDLIRHLEHMVFLQIMDSKWKDHLFAMDKLREGIGLRAYGQRDPLVEYKREAYEYFSQMIVSIEEEAAEMIFKLQTAKKERTRGVFSSISQELIHPEASRVPPPQEISEGLEPAPAVQPSLIGGAPVKLSQPKVGRNDPCPCGSGKKYKKCCGK
ncbi:MAG: preprotein translocase subunit SecA [Candidatus Omnitrophota bacterium]